METEMPKQTPKQKVSAFFKATLPYIIIVIVVALIRSFIITPVQVEGMSMYSTLNDKEILLLKKYDKSYKRFDIVVFNYNGTKLIKRVIGLPGDQISIIDNKVYINGRYYEEDYLKDIDTPDFDLQDLGYNTVPDGMYFVLGDNRDNSLDSRKIGLVEKDDIIGEIAIRFWPITKFRLF